MNDPNEEMLLDIVQITPEHIRANGTLHTSPWAAMTEIIDNCVDSKATNVHISYRQKGGSKTMGDSTHLLISDDGSGMSRIEALKMLLIGYSIKKGNNDSIGQFGNGLKSGSMRLGESMLLVSKQRKDYTALLISLKYLETIGGHKCYVPCLSFEYDAKSQTWDPIRLLGESRAKHDRALKAILEYSPFKTEELLKAYMTSCIVGKTSGTAILISDLKKVENGQYELLMDKGDVVLNDREPIAVPEAEEPKKGQKKKQQQTKKKLNDDEIRPVRCLSEWLQEVYLNTSITMFLNDRQVQQRDPIRWLADPRWSYLSSTGIETFIAREKQNMEKEKMRINELITDKESSCGRLESEISMHKGTAEELKQLRRDHRSVHGDLTNLKATFQNLSTAVANKKSGTDIKVYCGINVIRRCDARIVFYTNGRRIMTVPFKKDKFKKLMGVVCIVNIPATLLPPSQNREHFEVPSEVTLLVKKITTIAENYFARADPKYKSDQFWYDHGYLPAFAQNDCAENYMLPKILRLIGFRKQCSVCRLFRNAEVLDTEKLDSLEDRYCCEGRVTVNTGNGGSFLSCPRKTQRELEAEEIKELNMRDKPTYYTADKAVIEDPFDPKKGKEEKGKNANEPPKKKAAEVRARSSSAESARSPSPPRLRDRSGTERSARFTESYKDQSDHRPHAAKRHKKDHDNRRSNSMVVPKEEDERPRRPVSSIETAAKKVAASRKNTQKRRIEEIFGASDDEEEENGDERAESVDQEDEEQSELFTNQDYESLSKSTLIQELTDSKEENARVNASLRVLSRQLKLATAKNQQKLREKIISAMIELDSHENPTEFLNNFVARKFMK